MLCTATVITNKLMPINNCLEHSRQSDRYISTPVQNRSASSSSRALGTGKARSPAPRKEQPSSSSCSTLPHSPAPHQKVNRSKPPSTRNMQVEEGVQEASWEKPAGYRCCDEQQCGPWPFLLQRRAPAVLGTWGTPKQSLKNIL